MSEKWTALDREVVELKERGDLESAIRAARRSIGFGEELVGVDDEALVPRLRQLAIVYMLKHEHLQAVRLIERVVAILQKKYGTEHTEVAHSLNQLGVVCELSLKYRWRATRLFERALGILERCLGPNDREVAMNLEYLAKRYALGERREDAEKLLWRAVSIRGAAKGVNETELAKSLHELASFYEEGGDEYKGGALSALGDSKVGATQTVDWRALSARLKKVAGSLMEEGKYQGAEYLYKEVAEISEGVLGPDDPEVAEALESVAGACVMLEEGWRAEELYQRALLIREKSLGPVDSTLAEDLEMLAAIYSGWGQFDLAVELLERAAAIRQTAGFDHGGMFAVLKAMAEVFEAKGEYGKAESYYRRALSIAEKWVARDETSVGHVLGSCWGVLVKLGRREEAEEFRRKALAILPDGCYTEAGGFLVPGETGDD